jgi:hypothetical protein
MYSRWYSKNSVKGQITCLQDSDLHKLVDQDSVEDTMRVYIGHKLLNDESRVIVISTHTESLLTNPGHHRTVPLPLWKNITVTIWGNSVMLLSHAKPLYNRCGSGG